MSDPKFFNNQEYRELPEENSNNYYNDGTQMLANKGLVLSFQHVPSQTSVYFKAFITAFNETYTSDWSAESVYGRADPIYLFKQTQRKITLAFKIPAGTESEAYENLSKVQKLVQFLYPSYTDTTSATTITQSPLIRLKVMNLAYNADQVPLDQESLNKVNPRTQFGGYKTNSDAGNGLLGVVNNLTVNHNLETPDIGVIEKNTAGNFEAILPKLIEINLDFSPIHETSLGWWESEEFSNSDFPYGAPNMDAKGDQATSQGGTTFDGSYTARYGHGSDVVGALHKPLAGGFGFDTSPTKAYGPDLSAYDWPQLNQEDGGNEDEGYTTEQQIANAEARYAGLFGNARLNRDLRRMAKGKDQNEYVESAIGGALQGNTQLRSEGATLYGDDAADYVVGAKTEQLLKEV